MKEISVDVVLALPARQELRRVKLPEKATVADALDASGLATEFPEVDVSRVGVYGRLAGPTTALHDGDRVEIYRALKVDPRESRLGRARARRPKK